MLPVQAFFETKKLTSKHQLVLAQAHCVFKALPISKMDEAVDILLMALPRTDKDLIDLAALGKLFPDLVSGDVGGKGTDPQGPLFFAHGIGRAHV